MKQVLMSTTNSVENAKSIEYLGVVSAHVVTGAGYLSDLAASFTDFFGGRSGSYQRQLESIYDEALEELSRKATAKGGNAVLGLKMDIDNISGKGMSMFMITAMGTAASIQFEKEEKQIDIPNAITSSALINEIAKRRILKILGDDSTALPKEDWEAILLHPDKDYALPITRRYFYVKARSLQYAEDYLQAFQNNYSSYVQSVDRSLIIPGVYEQMKNPDYVPAARKLIRELALFDAPNILDLIRNGFLSEALQVLEAEQPSYNEEDLAGMEAIVTCLDQLPDIGRVEFVKGGVFAKDGKRYVCQCGHKNDLDVEFCSDCGRNIKGLNRYQVEVTNIFKNRVAVLHEMFLRDK